MVDCCYLYSYASFFFINNRCKYLARRNHLELSTLEDFLTGIDDVVDLREGHSFKVGSIRKRNIETSDSFKRSIKIVEARA